MFEITVADHAISGLQSKTAAPHGLILALHGGGYDARYWQAGEDYESSLLRLGTTLGYDVLAVDRPGYGRSSTVEPRGYPLARQADLLFALLDRVAPPDLPVFLIGHSMGGILALRMAAHERGTRLTAIDVSGVPLRYPAAMQPIIDRSAAAALSQDAPTAGFGAEARRAMFYAGDDTFDPAVVAKGDWGVPMPPAEMTDALQAPSTLPPLMKQISVPVQWTIAADERTSERGLPMLDYVRSLLPACPRVLTSLQRASGHNISLHHVARAYHLRAFAFFEECRLS